MADLTSTGVSILESWEEGGVDSKRFVARRVRLTLSGQGTTTNKIPASVLKMTKVVSATPMVKSDNTVIVPASPDYARDNLLAGGGSSNAPQDLTGVFDVIVRGTREV